MNKLASQIESLLFVATKPMTSKQLSVLLECAIDDVKKAIDELVLLKNIDDSGIHVIIGDEGAQLVSNPLFSDVVSALSKEETDSELSRPSLEALTIVAYRGPITKPEIEAIRGVNCAMILRNLLMRGLINEEEDLIKLQPVYSLSNDALRLLGLHHVSELSEFEELHGNNKIDKLLATLTSQADV